MNKYASKKLSRALAGKQLKISIEIGPHQFLVLDEAHMNFSATVPEYNIRMKRPTITKDGINDFVTNYEKNGSFLSQRIADPLECELFLITQ